MGDDTYGYGESAEIRGALADLVRKLAGESSKDWASILAMLIKVEDSVSLLETLKKLTDNSFVVTVDYGRTLEVAILAGRYTWVNEDIIANPFPASQSGVIKEKIELVHFGRRLSVEQTLTELEMRGLRPVDIYELLAFGEQHPDVQREFLIAALGSVRREPDGNCSIPCLDRGRMGARELDIGSISNDFYPFCRFAAVRK